MFFHDKLAHASLALEGVAHAHLEALLLAAVLQRAASTQRRDHGILAVVVPGIGVPQWWYSIWLPVLSALITLRALGLFIRKGRDTMDTAQEQQP